VTVRREACQIEAPFGTVPEASASATVDLMCHYCSETDEASISWLLRLHYCAISFCMRGSRSGFVLHCRMRHCSTKLKLLPSNRDSLTCWRQVREHCSRDFWVSVGRPIWDGWTGLIATVPMLQYKTVPFDQYSVNSACYSDLRRGHCSSRLRSLFIFVPSLLHVSEVGPVPRGQKRRFLLQRAQAEFSLMMFTL
jgi:hypothetical protein